MSDTQNIHKTGYWPHIDGLRALAVLAVLFFHFETPGFGSGYLGVDIFFVISGFLVTRLIMRDVQDHGKMRFKRFFARRIRRLFPTLAAVCIVTAIFAYALLGPQQLADFGKSVAAAVISLSNIQFWSESGYFDTASDTKPLLHTWSLSVEEQFYLIWPATLALGYKLFKDKALATLSIAGFFLSIGLIAIWKLGQFDARADSTIFFWMPFRVYEFMMGAIAILIYGAVQNTASKAGLKWFQDFICVLGVALMLGAIIIPSFTGEPFGPVLGFIACLGAVLVILAPQAILSTKLFALKPVRWIGQISYSLYLVHWPLWVFLPEHLRHLPWMWVALIALSILITIPLHYLIETPLRKGGLNKYFKDRKNADLASFAAAAVAVVAAGVFIASSTHLPFRNAPLLTAEQIEVGKSKRLSEQNCIINKFDDSDGCKKKSKVQILFFGNSHEIDGLNIFNAVYNENDDVNLISFGGNQPCDIKILENSFASKPRARNCNKRTSALNNLLGRGIITHIVYSSNLPFKGNKGNSWAVLKRIKTNHPKIELIVMSGFLNTSEDCSIIANRHRDFSKCFSEEYYSEEFKKSFPDHEDKIDRSKFPLEFTYIDKVKLLCPERKIENCVASINGVPAFYDQHHLSFEYAQYIGREMRKAYQDEFRKIGLP